ncbi:MAG: efflux RND transporter permease subunit [Dysgonamonadaceae bacterium]|jgi:multidrug efflux pump subunit AcrB|nr:efflux RND transporter permease subunit [Dysgonamonadaceae bacterium]
MNQENQKNHISDKNNKVIEWAMHNRQIILLLVVVLFVAGIYSLQKMPKQEMPEMVIRQGVVIGIFPGASAEQVEEQLTKPLERYLFTYTEVKRAKTHSKSEDGIAYIFVELADEIKEKNIVWSKIKHGLTQFKSSLPTGVLAVIANDNFADVSAILITMESDDKTPREIDGYCDALEDRLRTIPDVANIRRSGSQNEQITVYVDNEKLAAYNIGSSMLMANLMAQGFTTTSGELKNNRIIMPIHIAETFGNEQEIANQIIFASPQGDVVRVKDIGRVVREYPQNDSYITNNGKRCVLLSVEVNPKANIVAFGEEVNVVLEKFKAEKLPASVNINRIADQPKIVGESVNHFLLELVIAVLAVILVTMLLLPFRVAIVAAMSIPITVAISLAIFYMAGLPLNMVTLVGLIVVLGMIVDNSIVIVDSYIDKLDSGKNRWESAIRSAQEYFKSILSATLAISITFFPLVLTTKGAMSDMLQHFPWAISITLFISLAVAMLVIPIIQYFLIKKGLHSDNKQRRTILDYVQSSYEWLLAKVFAYPKTTIIIALASIIVGSWLFSNLPQRMMPIAERDQFAVEIYLHKGSPLEKTAAVADSMENILRTDERVTSVSAFIGTSSPRFHSVYAPQMPSKSYAQFIVNTVSNKATEAMLDEYSDKYAYYFPEAYVRFKQLDFQAVDAAIDVRLIGEDIESLKHQAEKISNYLQTLNECTFVRTSFDAPSQGVKIELNPTEAGRLGINKTLVSLGISSGLTGMKISDLWEENYAVPVCIEPENVENAVSDLQNVQISGMLGAAVPLRQIATITPEWNESVITHRNGMRTLSVLSDVRRSAYDNVVFEKVRRYVDSEIIPQLPDNITLKYGGAVELEEEVMKPMVTAMLIAFVIMFFILVFHFRKIKMAVIVMLSAALSIFGAAFGVWVLGIDFSSFAILGIIGLAGIIIRNGIIMFDYIEFLRFTKGRTVRQAAYAAGKRRMRPIFLTSACASMGVLPMIISANPMWAGMAAIIFFGTLISMILIVTVMPVVYWLIYRKQDKVSIKN